MVYWTRTEVCLRPAPFTPKPELGGARVTHVALFGKRAAAGVSVSANNVELDGLGVRHAVSETEPWALNDESALLNTDALHGCVLVRGLAPGCAYVFATGAYDAHGEPVGAIGRTSDEVVTCLPLPRLLIWAYVCRAATQLGCPRVAADALAELQAAYVLRTPRDDLGAARARDGALSLIHI